MHPVREGDAMKDWCKGKTKEQVEDELWRQIQTYNICDLRDFFFDSLSFKSKKDWVNSWHDNDEEDVKPKTKGVFPWSKKR